MPDEANDAKRPKDKQPQQDEKNIRTRRSRARSQETLKFYYTPTDPAGKEDAPNPHGKDSTHLPEIVEALKDTFESDVHHVEIYANEHTVYVTRERIVDVCRYLKEERGFTYLSDLGGIDRFEEEDRFEVYYNLLNLKAQQRIRIKIRVDEQDLTVPTVTPLYKAAGWNEREVYDMLGIRFTDHPDMRRMYMPEDFEHHPQRKEFPLLGIPGSLPLPPQTPEGELTMDPFAAAHGSKPIKSYEEPRSKSYDEEDEE